MKKVMATALVLGVSLLAGCVNDPYYGDRGYYADGAYYSGRVSGDRGYGYPERRSDRYENRRYHYYR